MHTCTIVHSTKRYNDSAITDLTQFGNISKSVQHYWLDLKSRWIKESKQNSASMYWMSCVDTYDQEDDHQHSEKNVCSLELLDLSPVLPQFLRERFRLEPRLVVQGFHLEADNSLTLHISTNIETFHKTSNFRDAHPTWYPTPSNAVYTNNVQPSQRRQLLSCSKNSRVVSHGNQVLPLNNSSAQLVTQ